MLKIAKATPFGSHFSTKLEGANNKLICALSSTTACIDDVGGTPRPVGWTPGGTEPLRPEGIEIV